MRKSTPFYRLTHDEWKQANQELTQTQVLVLYHLRTLDPYGDESIDVRIDEIAQGTRLSRGAVSRAITELNKKGWLLIEAV